MAARKARHRVGATPRKVAPPSQLRSRRTLERILDATQDLLEKSDFEGLSVQEIVKKAGCSVGAFYGRLRDKEALLDALDERHVAEFASRVEAVLEASESLVLPALVRRVFESLVRFHREHRGLIRTLVLRARRAPNQRYRQREQRLHALVPRLRGLVLEHRKRLRHPQPARAAELGLVMVLFTVRELVLWEHLAAIVPVSDERLTRELTRAFLAYVGSPLGPDTAGGKQR